MIIIVDRYTDITFSDDTQMNWSANYPLSTVESEFLSYSNCNSKTQTDEKNKQISTNKVTYIIN